jgi:hypothetical protein
MRYLAGEYRPADMTTEEYTEVLGSSPDEQMQALDMLDLS